MSKREGRVRNFRQPAPPLADRRDIRFNAREVMLSVDDYKGVPRPRAGVYRTPGRGQNGESSN